MSERFTIPQSDILRGKRVVICEDDALTFMHLARLFEKAGAQVVGNAADGMEAIKVIRKHKPDLVTMDIQMPFMNGIKAIHRVREENDTCIVVVSAYAEARTKQEAIEAGACAFIGKPINAHETVRAIEEAFIKFQGMSAPPPAAAPQPTAAP